MHFSFININNLYASLLFVLKGRTMLRVIDYFCNQINNHG